MTNRHLSTGTLSVLLMLGLTGCQPVELPAAPAVALDTYPPAIRQQLENALRTKHPRKANDNGRIAMLLHTYDQLHSAEVYYTRAALLDTDDFRWPYLRAWVRFDSGNIDGAMLDLRQALVIDPDYPRARIKLAELLLASGELRECHDTLTALQRDYPDRAEAYFIAAQLALREKDPDRAIKALEKVQSMTGDFGALHHTYAQAYRQTRDEPAMRQHTLLAEQFANTTANIADPVMAEVLSLNISTANRLDHARRLASRGQTERALQVLEDTLADDPGSLPVHLTLAGIYASKSEFARADQHLEYVRQIEPQHPKLHYNTGLARLAEQRFVEAEQAFRDSLAVDPNNADAWTQLGLVQETHGNVDDAMSSYQMALQKNNWHRQAHWLLGRRLHSAGRTTEAIAHLELLRTARDPSSAIILLDLGRAYQAAGLLDDAVAVLGEAIVAAEQFGDKQSPITARALLRRIGKDQ